MAEAQLLLVALFALALASAGLSIRLYIVPCEKDGVHHAQHVHDHHVTSFENVSVLENVTVTETVLAHARRHNTLTQVTVLRTYNWPRM